MRRYLRTAAALCLALCLSLALLPAPALAEEPETAPGEVQAPEEERTEAPEETPAEGTEGTGEEPPAPGEENPAGETGEEPPEEVWEEVTAEGVFQAGAISGPQTMPDEISFFAASLSDTIAAGMAAQQKEIDVSGFHPTSAEVKEAYAKALNDHPELFYVQSEWTNYGYGDGYVTKIAPHYDESLTTQAAKTSFSNAVSQALAQVKSGMTDLEKALVLHDYLVVNCRYNWYVSHGQESLAPKKVWSAYGALVDGDAVCQGYALAYKYLLNQAGITAVTLSSDAMEHMWNQVQIGGKWYHVDATWDDPTPNTDGKCQHSNFLRSDTGIGGTGHRDWDTTAYSCPEDTYASGYVFSGNRWPVYYRDGKFYYIEHMSGQNYQIKSGTLEKQDGGLVGEPFTPFLNQKVNGTSISWSIDAFSVVWLEDNVYYIGYPDKKLHARSLTSGGEAVSASSAGSLSEIAGLRYDGANFYATSCAVYDGDLATFEYITADPIPPEWKEKPQGICGLTSGGTKAGIKWNANQAATLFVAGYNENNRLTSIQAIDATLKNGVTLVDITKPGSVAAFRLFLASSSKPLCAAWTER